MGNKDNKETKSDNESLSTQGSNQDNQALYNNYVNPFDNVDYFSRQKNPLRSERQINAIGYQSQETFDTIHTNIHIYSLHRTAQVLSESFSKVEFGDASSIVSFVESCAKENRLDIAFSIVTYTQEIYEKGFMQDQPNKKQLLDMEPLYLALLDVCQFSDAVDVLYTTLDLMKKKNITIQFENLPRAIFACCAVDAADKAIEFLNLY